MIIRQAFRVFKQIAWFLPGYVLFASFPPLSERMDVLFALAPLMWLARRGNKRESLKRWTQSGLFFYLATLAWMPAIIKNGGPWPLVFLGWFALAAYCTLYFAAYGYLSAAYWHWANNDARSVLRSHGDGGSTKHETLFRVVGILFVEPVLWCGLELIRSTLAGGFAWNQLGVVPANSGFGAPAALGGVYLLSAIVILINGSVAGIIERMIARGTLSRWRSLETILVFALVFAVYKGSAYKTSLSSVASAKEDQPSLKVALVQRNFPCCFMEREERPADIYGVLLARASFMKSDLVVLPESAIGEFGLLDSARGIAAFEFVRTNAMASAVLAGGTRLSRDRKAEYNSAGLYQDGVLSCYDKVHLVPFGEYIPFDKTFTSLQALAPVGSCTPGKPKLLYLTTNRQSPTTIPFGVAICYEDTDSALIREYAKKGAAFLVFITNDSWFSHSNEALAHSWQATARAIETGLEVIRVGNSGVTALITPEGKVSVLADQHGKPLVDRAAVMTGLVRPRAAGTPYLVVGDWPLSILFALLIGGMILVKYSDKLRRERLLK